MNPSHYQSTTESHLTNEPAVATYDGNSSTNRLPNAPQGGSGSFPNRLSVEMAAFNKVLATVQSSVTTMASFDDRCQQAFNLANDLFGHAPTWICFYREVLGGNGIIHQLFTDRGDFGRFLRTEQYHQIQMMLTALRSRDLPENDPNDPQRMITVRLPKSLHEAMCAEASRLNISVNRLCISRMLQLLDPKMIPETQSKPRGRKPRLGNPMPASALRQAATTSQGNGEMPASPTSSGSVPPESLGSMGGYLGNTPSNW